MNCYDSERCIKKLDLLIAEDTEFNLTRNRVYVALDGDNHGLVLIKNDENKEELYSIEYFKFYNGETIDW